MLEWEIDVNFASTYRQDLDWLQKLNPQSVMLAEGSGITVEKKRKIRLGRES